MAYGTVYENTYERLPILTNAGHCARALSFLERGDIYFALGRTSPWKNENDKEFIPPEPDVNAETLDELIGVKKADRVTMVIPDERGEIEYSSIKFRTITTEEALTLKSRWVLVEATIGFEELPPHPYRQIGIFSRLTPKEEFELKRALLPEEIENVGILEVLNNRKAVTRQSDTRDTYMMIIEF